MKLSIVAVFVLASRMAFAQGAGDMAPPAAAPPPPPPMAPLEPEPFVRAGVFGGGGVFGGNISCDGSSCGSFSKGGGAAGYIGYMLSPRLGLLVDVWAMTARDSSGNTDTTLTFVAGTANLRYYLLPALWVQGGIGNGHAEVHVSIFQARSDDVPVGLIAAGVEVAQGRTWALDVAVKLAQGTSTSSSSDSGDTTTGRMVGVGANITWF